MIRILVRTDDACMAANCGGAVETRDGQMPLTPTELQSKRVELLAIARTTDDPGVKQWCRTFAANLGLLASADTETRERGLTMLRFNADNCDRLYLRRQYGE